MNDYVLVTEICDPAGRNSRVHRTVRANRLQGGIAGTSKNAAFDVL